MLNLDEHLGTYRSMQKELHTDIVRAVEAHVTQFKRTTGILVKSVKVSITQQDQLDDKVMNEGYMTDVEIEIKM